MKEQNYIDNLNDDNFNDDEIDNKNNHINKNSSKVTLPFLRVNIEKISDLNNISNKVDKSKVLINSQTDKLLITGFEGDEEDFKQCYKIIEPIKIKKISNIKQRKLNKLLVKDDYFGPIKLTKIKEFNMTLRTKNKLLEKINQFKLLKNSNSGDYKRYYRNNRDIINSIINNNTSKINNNSIYNISSSINGNNILYNSSSTNNIFNNSTTNNFYNNSLNSLKGSYFFYKNNSQSKTPHHMKKGSINQNNLMTLRDILTSTSHNMININDKLKKYIRRNKDIYTVSYSENQKPKKIKINNKNKKSSLYEVLDSIKKKDKDQILKQIKNDEGTNSQNIWIKKSTANLISFGKAFLYLADDLFFREHKRIVDNYPNLERDADLPVVEKNNKNLIKKLHKMKMEKNSRVMKDLNYNNNLLVKKLNKRMKKSQSEDKNIN